MCLFLRREGSRRTRDHPPKVHPRPGLSGLSLHKLGKVHPCEGFGRCRHYATVDAGGADHPTTSPKRSDSGQPGDIRMIHGQGRCHDHDVDAVRQDCSTLVPGAPW